MWSEAPQLYQDPTHESPVRADPDDLLLIAGYGLRIDDIVVYRALGSPGELTAPTAVPRSSNAEFGVAEVVSTENVPDSLTVRLPQMLRVDQTYAIWVRTVRGEWSRPVLINDARPLWVTPSFVYETASVPSFPREIKVVGRNLRSAQSGQRTIIKLIGPETLSMAAMQERNALDRYVARAALPDRLRAGSYRVLLSRDARSWSELGQKLAVRPDPPAPLRFEVSDARFGNCRPDDGRDDTSCILRAIAAAKASGGGVVSFAPGTWDLTDDSQAGVVPGEGIMVADGVSLLGAGRGQTRLDRHATWGAHFAEPVFTLLGHTTVRGFDFRDLRVYAAQDYLGPFLQLGEHFARAAATGVDPSHASADDIVIADNIFDKPFIAIADGGLPMHRLFVVGNEFGAFFEALRFTGHQDNVVYPYRIDDSVIDGNVFKPGSKLDRTHNNGPIASEIGAGLRVDFSGNRADGASTEYLYPGDTARGWEAAFFWNVNNNVEELLVAENSAICSGDKIGDGPAISFDNSGNTYALPTVSAIVAASRAGVTVATPLVPRQNSKAVALATYYQEHWIQIVSGPGIGQVRKIRSYVTDPRSGATTFQVTPAWDVVPVVGQTRMSVGREYWQVYAITNESDQRQPLCQKSNRSRQHGGGIGMWSQTADSVIEGNRQFDTDGILTQQIYVLPEHPCADCGMEGLFQYFLEIRDNTIDGEYNWDIDCSASGIALGSAAAPWNDPAPPTVGYGVSIAHNHVRHADAAQGGAVAQMASWWPGPEPRRWPLSNNVLIYHNDIRDNQGPPAVALCNKSHPRSGISFPTDPISWRTVLYGNTCTHVTQPIEGDGVDTVRVCPAPVADSCECH